ncbi:3-phosphoglycerate dehydrogenase [Lactiplantibacillus garii]|uniref:3-phosphoglycerate dehydrogenase n=1 Tax=Lactiplantibacillus garii TaxID=2306423 RepID=A0A3R8J5U3_9LACO|nr:phosphoglycerate dehydrogenase [Lactiplantibacillus garii]RRK09409.1 3-phosphoglycerate dehydrogenase [Lactiplantibacillus garii]
MPIALMVQATKPAQLATIKAQYPEWQFKTVAELTPADYDQVEVMFGNHPVLNQLLARPTSRLKWLQVISAGVDYLPLKALAQAHVLVTNTSGIHADAIGESVLAAMLTVVRGYHAAWVNQTGAKQWALPVRTTTLTDKQLLIFGTGQIGQSIAKKATALGMRIVGVNTSGHPATNFDDTVALHDTDQALAQADFIVNALPLTPTTHHLFNADLFAKTTRSPMLINIGRGPAVSTPDLVAALDRHQLSMAALDVTEPEPLAPSDPLWQRDDVLITPHISGQIDHFRATVFAIFAANFAQYVKDGTLARNQVDLTRGY